MRNEFIFKLKLIFIPCQENNYRPKFLESQFLIYYLLFLIILKLSIIPFFLFFPKTIFFAEISKLTLINLTNEERKNLGIPNLKENPKLSEAAFLKAMDILEKDYFSHWSPDGFSPWYWFQKVGYNYQFAGENLAIGFLDSKEVIQAWIESPSHKRNLLDSNYQEIGIAVVKGEFQGSEAVVVVQLFGTPKSVAMEKPPKPRVPSKEIVQKEEIQSQKEILSEKEEEKEELFQKDKFSEKEISIPSQIDETTIFPKGLTFNFLSFFSSKYFDVLQKIIFFSLILIFLSLIINIFIKIKIQHLDLILKTFGIIILLILIFSLDQLTIIRLIPHNFRIY